MRFQSYFLFGLLFFAASVFAQQPASNRLCGYTGKSPWLDWYQQHRHELAQDRGADTAWLYVPMTLHLVGTDNGTGYYKLEQALRAVCEMNEQFAEARIRYYLVPGDGVRYHKNSSWYAHEFYPGGDDMINSNRLPNRMNTFVVSDPAGNCGYAWQDAIVLGTGCSGPGNTTWAHEAGHHLSLPHPFSGWEGFSWDFTKPAPLVVNGREVEKADTSNCYWAGDGFCDTRPDYLNYRWSCNADNESGTIQRDPDGVQFRSDASIIMGYALDACASRFSPEQIEAMRANLQDEDEHLNYIVQTPPINEIADDISVELISPIDSQIVHYKNVTLHWNPVPGATMYVVEVGLTPNLVPKFYSEAFPGNTTSVTITSGIPNNRALKWRVRAYNEWDVCQPHDKSNEGIFKTKNLSATNELEQVALFELAPNPVPEGLPAVLTVTTDETMDAMLNLTDAAGRLCQTLQLRILPGENRIEIPTDGLNAGLYVVTLHNEKGTMVKRLAVAN